MIPLGHLHRITRGHPLLTCVALHLFLAGPDDDAQPSLDRRWLVDHMSQDDGIERVFRWWIQECRVDRRDAQPKCDRITDEDRVFLKDVLRGNTPHHRWWGTAAVLKRKGLLNDDNNIIAPLLEEALRQWENILEVPGGQ